MVAVAEAVAGSEVVKMLSEEELTRAAKESAGLHHCSAFDTDCNPKWPQMVLGMQSGLSPSSHRSK